MVLTAGEVAHILGVDAVRAKRRRSQASHRYALLTC